MVNDNNYCKMAVCWLGPYTHGARRFSSKSEAGSHRMTSELIEDKGGKFVANLVGSVFGGKAFLEY